ncbi:MAG: hypothetical protein IH939_04570 [Acidobacteria bacterium]|nr:hypothetical protein [Acidobacteriota bacterium]
MASGSSKCRSPPLFARFARFATAAGGRARPTASGRPSTPDEAAGAEVWTPGAGFGTRLAQLAVELSLIGPQIFDLQIGLMAFEGGATQLWTADRRCVSTPGRSVVHACEGEGFGRE